jgi:hypothetical protein
VLAVLEQVRDLGLRALKIVGMDPLAPEIRVVEIFARGVAEQRLDIGADEGGRKVSACLEAVNHSRRGTEQLREPLRRVGLHLTEQLVLGLFLLARGRVQNLFDPPNRRRQAWYAASLSGRPPPSRRIVCPGA